MCFKARLSSPITFVKIKRTNICTIIIKMCVCADVFILLYLWAYIRRKKDYTFLSTIHTCMLCENICKKDFYISHLFVFTHKLDLIIQHIHIYSWVVIIVYMKMSALLTSYRDLCHIYMYKRNLNPKAFTWLYMEYHQQLPHIFSHERVESLLKYMT